MLHQPAGDVPAGLGGVLQIFHIGHFLVFGLRAPRLAGGQRRREGVVQTDVVAVHAVHAEAHMVDADHVRHILEVLHEAVDVVGHVGLGHGGVGRGFDADHAVLLAHGADQLVAGHALGGPHALRAHMGGDDGLAGVHHRIVGSPGAAVGHVDQHAHLVHALHALLAELRQSPVVVFPAAAAQGVALGVGHAHLPDAQAVEDVDAVDLVLDGRGALNDGHPGDLPGLLRLEDVLHALAVHQEILVVDVAQAHAQIVHDVDPLPSRLAGDDVRAVHHVVEDAVQMGIGQRLVAAAVAAGAHGVKQRFAGGHVPGGEIRMVVQADVGMLPQQPLHPGLLGRVQLDYMPARPVPVRPVDDLVVHAGLQIGEGLIGAIAPLVFHLHRNHLMPRPRAARGWRFRRSPWRCPRRCNCASPASARCSSSPR